MKARPPAEDMITRHCRYCLSDVPFLWHGLRLKDGSKIYVDDKGARWAGQRCPACERSRVLATVKCDRFERDLIVRELIQSGFQVLRKTFPIIVKKDEQIRRVLIRRAYTESGRIVLESPIEGLDAQDLTVLVFGSVRIYDHETMTQLRPVMCHYSEKPLRPEMTAIPLPETFR